MMVRNSIRKINRNAIAAARRTLKDNHGVSTLLAAPEANPKLAKNGKLGVLAAPMHLAPANLSGYEMCAMRSAGCTAACLHTAGNPAHMAQKHNSRVNKSRAYMEDRDAFMTALVAEIERHAAKADEKGMKPAVRLNATSDIPFETVAIKRKMVEGHGEDLIAPNIMALFPDVDFYDYTKITKRAVKWAQGGMPDNYHITFSATESNETACQRVLDAGGNVAMVFNTHPDNLETYSGYPVINGDETDYRPTDPTGVIVGLKAKGDAKADTSGFVRRVA